jgi:hypothetical protein
MFIYVNIIDRHTDRRTDGQTEKHRVYEIDTQNNVFTQTLYTFLKQ